MIKKITVGCLGLLLSINTAFALNEQHTAKVLESKSAGGYTYIKVEEKGKQYWAAVMRADIKVGQSVTFKEQIVMKNFKSKALNKTFDEIMFADLPKKKGISGADNVHGIHGNMIKKKAAEKKPDVKFNDGIVITKGAATEIDISDLYKNKEKYKNKNVTVKGHVLQVSNKVMGNTWVKIYNGKDSVIFRSPNEDEKITVGDEVKVTGTINTDVDFGYGYKYELLGVNGKFTVMPSKKVEKKASK